MSKSRTISRIELKDLVWSKPMIQLSAELGISDVGLRKVCERMGVPRPPQGYWLRGAKKKNTSKPSLKDGNYKETHTFHVPEKNVKKDSKAVDNSPAWLIQIKEHESKPENKITVSKSLEAPHLWVEKAQKIFEKETEDGGLIYIFKDKTASFSVSHKQSGRALRVMDAVLKGLEERGMKVKFKDSLMFACIEGEEIEFGIKEEQSRYHFSEKEKAKIRKKENYYSWMTGPNFEDRPNGKLKFYMKNEEVFNSYNARHVSDSLTSKLEYKCNAIMVALGKMSLAIKDKREENRLADIERKKWHRQWEKEREARALEEWRVKKFYQWQESWKETEQLRKFLAKLKIESSEFPEDHEVFNIIQAAEKQIALKDPFKSGKIKEVNYSGTQRILW